MSFFDDTCMMIHDYDQKGILHGAWILNDQHVISNVIHNYFTMLKYSESFEEMYNGDSAIMELLDTFSERFSKN